MANSRWQMSVTLVRNCEVSTPDGFDLASFTKSRFVRRMQKSRLSHSLSGGTLRWAFRESFPRLADSSELARLVKTEFWIL
jgi:hypothetical protein